MVDALVTERIRAGGAAEAADAIRNACLHLPAPGLRDEFGAFFDRFGHAKVVLLGEATRGTSEFYRARAAISQRLIERRGFNIVAIEADWPDASRVDRYVRHRPAGRSDEETFAQTITPLPTEPPHGVPETSPFGV